MATSNHFPAKRRSPAPWLWIGAVVAMAALMTVALALGAMRLTWPLDNRELFVFQQIRLPRVFLAALVGAILAVSGTALQAFFRNPLAEPSLAGVSGGGALGAALVILFPGTLGIFSVQMGAFAGALGAVWLVRQVAAFGGTTGSADLLLAGIAVNALAGAALGWCSYAAREEQLKDLTFWMLGSLSHANWKTELWVCALGLPPLLLLWLRAGTLNLLTLGEAEAFHLGCDWRKTERWLLTLIALGVGVSVAVCGMVGFVGLLGPHLARMLAGPDHRRLVPASALAGAALVVAADLVARLAVVPAELPLGVVTAAAGAPFFLWLMWQRKARV